MADDTRQKNGHCPEISLKNFAAAPRLPSASRMLQIMPGPTGSSCFGASERIRRRVPAYLLKKDGLAPHTHVVGDTVDAALTWKRPDLGRDRP